MRTVPDEMWALWDRGGPFAGDIGAPHGRVTVEKDWLLNTDGTVETPDPRKLPFRWFQRLDNSQIETEVPNVKSIDIDRSLDADAATMSLTIYNTTMDSNYAGSNRRLGKPGYFTWDQPNRAARARWDLIKGPWSDVLIPNALIRTYQGFGGRDKTLAQALEDGNVVLTGVWLIDEVRPGTGGMLEIRCRDMAKLLIEQQLYPPLIPFGMYPLSYKRWTDTWVTTPAIPFYDYTNPKQQSPAPLEGPKYGTDMAMSADGKGYWILGSDGGVFSYNVPFYGSRGGGQNPIEHFDNAPMVAMVADPLNRGYWLAAGDGGVFTFGETLTFEGSMGSQPINQPVTNMAAHPSGRGYWLVGRDGGVFAFGVAQFLGNMPPTNGRPVVDIAATPSGNGYYLLDDRGGVYAYGDAQFFGSAVGQVPDAPDIWNRICGMAVRPQGDGYWLLRGNGDVYAYGAAPYLNNVPNGGDWEAYKRLLQDPMMDIISTPSGDGYLMVAGDGGVFAFGDAPFYGSLPGPFQYNVRTEGNYKDYTDIIRDLLLWSGWLAEGTGKDDVYGNLETTGAFSEWPLGSDMFDKKSVIDGINQIKEIVGYHFWIDDEGAARFESPNWFIPGNYMEDGSHVQTTPEIDERLQLTDYSVTFSDKDIRSEIVISSRDPLKDQTGTVVSRARVDTAGLDLLRGMVRPALWVQENFKNSAESERMAELIAMHAARSLRMGQLSCVANPAIQINDQVRIQERNTKDTYVHYVRGVTTNMDLDAGTYMMTVTTNWMTQDWGEQ